MSGATPAAAVRGGSVTPEDEARANFYALLGRLYASAPDAALLRAIAGADELPVEPGNEAADTMAQAWRALVAASAAMDPDAAAQEYVDLFVGVGRSEVGLHASGYLSRPGTSVLAELRGELARLGLARQPGVSVFEDHLAAILEVMRVLVGGTPEMGPSPLPEQRKFFDAYVAAWTPACCTAIIQSTVANYYRRVAQFTDSFVAIERDSFAIE